MEKVAVITTINHPTETVERLSLLSDWDVVVVGDKKTPEDWSYKKVHYLSPRKQEELGYSTFHNLPWNHYSRKMLGYLYAIKNGASVVADIDDDNFPYDNWGNNLVWNESREILSSGNFLNVYKLFLEEDELIWPRGYPLELINRDEKITKRTENAKVGVWQYLADGSPDVDAIYRLVFDKEIFFSKKPSIVLNKGTACPFNSQNTFFSKEMFPLMFLPPYVSFRFTDILRGLVAQPIMWASDYYLGFAHATVVQKRNPHDYIEDFKLEVPVYQNVRNVLRLAVENTQIGRASCRERV